MPVKKRFKLNPIENLKLDDIYTIPASLQRIIEKVNDGDDLTDNETREWLMYYLYIITDNYRLSVKSLLSDHNWWLKCIEYHSGINEDKMNDFLSADFSEYTIEEFLQLIIEYFTVEELKCIFDNQ